MLPPGWKYKQIGGNRVKRVEFSPVKLEKMFGEFWRADEELVIRVSLRACGILELRAKPGWMTDLGSVPKRLKSFVDDGTGDLIILVGYLFHDGGYGLNFPNRKLLDTIMLEILDSSVKMGRIEATLAWVGVRVGGGSRWEKSPEDIEKARKLVDIHWLDK